MNSSTGIKSKAAALEILGKLIGENPDEKIAKAPAGKQDFAREELKLEQIAISLAIERVNALPAEVVSVTIRTSAGPSELISIHIVKH